jgi:predicted flap endonuclease-1-like 5' DNA nuclease
MQPFTTEQWAILALVLVIGWLLGLLSRHGSGKWRRAYEAERDAHARLRETHEARITAANARIAQLEPHEPVTIGSGVGAGIGAAASGRRDDLSLIRGIDRTGETRLNDAGIHGFRDITRMSASEEAALEGRLGAEPGLIARERWREQADLLAAGKTEEHRRTFGA